MARVLVVDDDSAMRRMINRVLTEAQHQVVEAENGLEGIQKFRSEGPEIIVMDLIMPDQDGIQTIQEIRQSGSNTGIIAISGGGVGSSEMYLSMARDLGADVVVEKPFRPEDLLAAVDELLNRDRPAP